MKPNAVVTGALGGIGQAICTALRKRGYLVIGVDRQEGIADVDHLAHVDIRQLRRNSALIREPLDMIRRLLNGRVALLVNNAATQIVKPVQDITLDDWDETLDTNLLAPFLLIQSFLPELRAAKGSVVNVASIHAFETRSHFGVYATSKGALLALTRALAVELAPEVRVNAIVPAATDTPMLRAGFEGNPEGLETLGQYHPLRRIARPDEVASVVAFLASSDSSFMTGTAVHVDGGIGSVLHGPLVVP